MAAGYFSLLAQREVTKRKAPSDPRRSRSERFAAGERVRLTGHPWPAAESARSLAPPARCAAFPFALRRFSEGPESKSIGKMDSGLRRNDGLGGRRISAASSINGVVICGDTSRRFCGRDCRALLFPGPSRPRRAGAGNCREAVAGRMPASSTSVHGRTVGEPRSLLAQFAGRTPANRGREGVFLLVTSLWTSKEK